MSISTWLFADGLLGSAEEGVGDEAADDGSEDGGHPEEPELTHRPASDEECRASAAGRVDGGVGDGDADEVDEGEAEADGDGGEALGGTLIGGAKDDEKEEAVRTTSITKQASRE